MSSNLLHVPFPDEEDELFWKRSCARLEKYASFWKNEVAVEEIKLSEGHYSAVDTLMFIKVEILERAVGLAL